MLLKSSFDYVVFDVFDVENTLDESEHVGIEVVVSKIENGAKVEINNSDYTITGEFYTTDDKPYFVMDLNGYKPNFYFMTSDEMLDTFIIDGYDPKQKKKDDISSILELLNKIELNTRN